MLDRRRRWRANINSTFGRYGYGFYFNPFNAIHDAIIAFNSSYHQITVLGIESNQNLQRCGPKINKYMNNFLQITVVGRGSEYKF